MKFGRKDLINTIEICDSVLRTIPVNVTNIPMYQATIQSADHVLNNLKGGIDVKLISKLKDLTRQLKSDLYLYFRTELKNAPQVKTNIDEFFRNEYLNSYIKEHAEEIIKTEEEIQKKSVLGNLGIFTKFEQNNINPEIIDIQATLK